MKLITLRVLRLLLFGLVVLTVVLAAALIWPPQSDLTSLGAPAPAKAALGGPARETAPGFNYFVSLRRSRMFSERKKAVAKSTDQTKERQVASLAGYRLVGLMSGGPDKSFAVVENTTTGRQEVVGLGDTVGEGRVIAVKPDRIVVQLRQSRTELVLTDDPARQLKGVLSVRERAKTASRGEGGEVRELEDGRRGVEVVEPGPHGYEMGLEPGDIVVFPSPNMIKRYLSGGMKGGIPVVVVQRGGQTIRLTQQAENSGRINGREPLGRE